jgi:hypothetical protein
MGRSAQHAQCCVVWRHEARELERDGRVRQVEMAGATSTLLYGVNLLFHPVNPPPPTEDGTLTGRPRVGAPYHARVLVPCYKESLDIVAKTLEAALAAELPAGCARTVYLLDDGKQRDKRKWCAAAGPGARATGGRSAPCRDDRKQRLSDQVAQRAGLEVISEQWKGRLRRRSASCL